MSDYDVIVIGAGHNSLVAAAYLARAGKRVLVLEKEDRAGGSTTTDTIAPRFRCPAAYGSVDLLHPSVVSELGLERHGLRRIPGRGPTLMLRPGGTPLAIPATNAADAIEKHSPADAAGFRDLERLIERTTAALEPIMSGPLPDIQPRGLGGLLDLLSLGWRLRRLGKKDMPEAMRLLPMALRDVAIECFSDELVQAAVIFPGLTGSWLGPFSPGGALSLLMHRPAWRAGLFDAPVFVAGGPGALADSLAAAATAAGAEIRTGAAVARIRASDDRATGVALENGGQIDAAQVVSGIDPRATLIGLLEPGWLDPEVVSATQHIRMRGTVSIVRFALDALPDFGQGSTSLGGRLRLGPSIEYLEKAFDNAKYGRLPAHPMLELTIPSLADPSLAPDGKHVMHVWVQYTPHTLRDGDWDSRRGELIETVVRAVESCAPGFSGSVLHSDAITPLDMERRWGLTGGHLYHGELALDQALYMRPIPGVYDYAMPLDGLFLCGPGCHAGGGVSGLPGKNAASRVLAR